MDFFDIGPLEILLIIIVALIVFGPEKMADIGKSLGKAIHSFRKSASDLTTQVNREIEEAKEAIRPAVDEVKAQGQSLATEVKAQSQSLVAEVKAQSQSQAAEDKSPSQPDKPQAQSGSAPT